MKRKKIRNPIDGAKAQAIEKITKSQRSKMKIRRRPILSASGPSSPAPKIAPTIAAAETKPSVVALRSYCCFSSGLTTPMMKKSKPSSRMPSAASSQKRLWRFDIFASSIAWPSETASELMDLRSISDGGGAVARSPRFHQKVTGD